MRNPPPRVGVGFVFTERLKQEVRGSREGCPSNGEYMPGVTHRALNLKEFTACILFNPFGAEVILESYAIYNSDNLCTSVL